MVWRQLSKGIAQTSFLLYGKQLFPHRNEIHDSEQVGELFCDYSLGLNNLRYLLSLNPIIVFL